MAKKNSHDQALINEVGERQAAAMGYELLEAAFERENGAVYLRFYLDKEGGVTLDDCEAYHRAIQPLMEHVAYDFMEVCSPGIDRPLKTARDAQRMMGQEIEVRLYRPQEGQKVFVGKLTEYTQGDITLDIAGEARTFLKKDIAVARGAVDEAEIENADPV